MSVGFFVASEANVTIWRRTNTCLVTAWAQYFLAGQEGTGLSYSAEFLIPVTGAYRIVFVNYSAEKEASISFSLSEKSSLATMVLASTIYSTETTMSQQGYSLGSLSSLSSFQQMLGAVGTGASIVAGWLFKTRKRRFLSRYLTKIDSVYNAYALNKEECKARLSRMRDEVTNMLKKGKIDANHFAILDDKLVEYLKEISAASTAMPSRAVRSASFCRRCGSRLRPASSFCVKCGLTRSKER
jgi:ribosomal protein L40E